MSELPILELRRIEANVIRPIYQEMVAALGEAKAQEILERAIRNNAIEQARALVAESDSSTGIAAFAELMERWKSGGALEIDVLHQDTKRYDFNVTRCQYAEMYREMGLASIGHLLSCNRDGAFCEGYDERLSLERSQTIMGGSPHCDFRYQYDDTGE